METLSLELNPPLEHDGGKIERLVLKEPRAASVLAAQKAATGNASADERARSVALIGYVADVPPEVVRNLPVSQFKGGAVLRPVP